MNDLPHGPHNADHELRKAYNCLIESSVTFSSVGTQIKEINPDEVQFMYKRAFTSHRKGHQLAAERWARSAKHLARAFWHEAKIHFLQNQSYDIPFLVGATAEEYNFRERLDTTVDLIQSVENHLPAGKDSMPENMIQYLNRAKKFLEQAPDIKHELLQAECIKAAHEYGRVIECLDLAYEATEKDKAA
ncbi:MAG: hypothetical protein H7222_04930 [Methylotenera sp.]|nr:hypothetical protein [Oligoflexia bacterium]